MTSEEGRAVEYRRMMQAREENKATRENAMRGDPAAEIALRRKVDALMPWAGWDPIRRVVGDEI